jgi:HAD superfamily hydrolase (TIGR01509 family)
MKRNAIIMGLTSGGLGGARLKAGFLGLLVGMLDRTYEGDYMSVKALIFDFDGLIVDTETLHFDTWTKLYQRYGVTLQVERWLLDLGTHGMTDLVAELEELIGQPVDREAIRLEQREQHVKLVEQEKLRPGILALLKAGKDAGLPMAVASSSDRNWVERWLGHHHIREYFSCVRSRDDVRRVKPDPELFLSAAECLGVAPAECVVLEDSPNGMRAAAAAGIRCIAVPTKLLRDVELPEVAVRLESLEDASLDDLISRIEAAAEARID